MKLHIAGVDYESLADADGVSCVIFFSGCRHKCVGCHSPQTHDFNYGEIVTEELINEINEEIDKRPFLSTLVLSGGDPMYSAKEIVEILPKLHIPNNNVWCFSGFRYEEIINDIDMKALLCKCNVLIDGVYDNNQRNIALRFRGSKNQRIINVQQSLEKENIILWEDTYGNRV